MFHILKSSSFKSPYTSNEDLFPLGILWPKRYVKSWTESSVCRGTTEQALYCPLVEQCFPLHVDFEHVKEAGGLGDVGITPVPKELILSIAGRGLTYKWKAATG